MRIQSTDARGVMSAQHTDDAFITLIEINHPQLAAPARVCDALEDLTSNGNVYAASGIDATLPSNEAGQLAGASLSIENVTQTLIKYVREFDVRPTVSLSVVRANKPDELLVSHPDYYGASASYDEQRITVDLSQEDFFNEPYPWQTHNAHDYPGYF